MVQIIGVSLMADITQLRRGSTSLLILSILQEKPLHGYAIMRELERRSDGFFKISAPLLYPTLHQMEQYGLIQGKWEDSETERRRKVYKITEKGIKKISRDKAGWGEFVTHLFKIIADDSSKLGEIDEV